MKTILVLGGGRLPQGGQTTLSLQRLDSAVELYSMGAAQSITVLGGLRSTYLPNALHFEIPGAQERAEYLRSRGVPSNAIWQIQDGRDTLGEAIAFQKGFVALGITEFILVTSAFHIPRSRWIFETVLAGACPFTCHEVPCGGILLADEEAEYLRVLKDYLAQRPTWRANLSDWHLNNPALYAEYKLIHDRFHPPGKESQAYFAVRTEVA